MPNSLLDKVLAPNALSTVFQPIYRAGATGFAPVIVECLSRGPVGTNATHAGVLFEYAQLKAAEPLVDRACIAAALKAIVTIKHSGRFSLNVFAATLVRDVPFVHWLARQTSQLHLDPASLIFELVEHGDAWDAQAFVSSLRDIRSLGSQIALDDVGLAHSNFQRILDCDPEFLKLDRCIVRNCDRDSRRQALLKSLASLAKDLGSNLIAEGVETDEEMNEVCSHDISLFQGFFFSKPVSAVELSGLLHTTVPRKLPQPAWGLGQTRGAAMLAASQRKA